MTKDWMPVKADICRLYSEGCSLEEVKEFLRTDRQFEASTRAFRFKIAEWKVKRPRVFSKEPACTRRVPQSSRKSRRRTRRADSVVIPVVNDENGSFVPTRSAETEALQHQHERIDITRTCSCRSKELEDHMEWLLASFDKETSKLTRGLGSCTELTPGADNILHTAARTSGMPRGLFAHLVECLGYLHQDMNTKDCDGMTALEIGARRSDPNAVQIILDAGASFQHCSIPQDTVLHVSMLHQASYTITAKILPHARRAGYLDTEAYMTLHNETMKVICHNIESPTGYTELKRYYNILRLILEDGKPGQSSDCSIDPIFKILVRTWDRNSRFLSSDYMNNRPSSCCQFLLEAGADVLAPSGRCTACGDLAGDPFFHHSSTALADVIVERSMPEHVDGLIKRVLSPCSLRIATVDEDRLPRLLDFLLGRRSQSLDDLLLYALEHTPDRLKLQFVRMILTTDFPGRIKALDLTLDADGASIVEKLMGIDESVRWPISEVIFLQDAGLKFLWEWPGAVDPDLMLSRRLTRCESTAYLDDILGRVREERGRTGISTIVSWLPTECVPHKNPHGPAHHGLLKTSDSNTTHQLQRCIVHVVTKMMLDPTAGLGKALPKKERLLWALELRRTFDLPDIKFDNSLLIDVLSWA